MKEQSVVFVWENFGPAHRDRCEAAALLLPPPWIVKGIELANKSISYDWDSSEEVAFEKITLFHVGRLLKFQSYKERGQRCVPAGACVLRHISSVTMSSQRPSYAQ